MSRIGKQPVKVPKDVKISISSNVVNIEGPKGKLNQVFHPDMSIELNQQDMQVFVKRRSEDKYHKALHGLTRALIANMVLGVTKGYSRNLEIVGLGYNAKVQGSQLLLSLGYTHPVRLEVPKGGCYESNESGETYCFWAGQASGWTIFCSYQRYEAARTI